MNDFQPVDLVRINQLLESHFDSILNQKLELEKNIKMNMQFQSN